MDALNYTWYNSSLMKVSVIPSADSLQNDLAFTWNCTSFSGNKMVI